MHFAYIHRHSREEIASGKRGRGFSRSGGHQIPGALDETTLSFQIPLCDWTIVSNKKFFISFSLNIDYQSNKRTII